MVDASSPLGKARKFYRHNRENSLRDVSVALLWNR